jgi:hypothetical protein
MSETNMDKFEGNDSVDVLKAYEYHKPEYPECANIVDWLRADYKEPAYELPEWIKVGNWIWSGYANKFEKITAIVPQHIERFQINFGTDRLGYIGSGILGQDFYPATVVPWTPEEAKAHIDEVVTLIVGGGEEQIKMVSTNGKREVWRVRFADEFSPCPSLKTLAECYTLKDSGLPCGTLKRVD